MFKYLCYILLCLMLFACKKEHFEEEKTGLIYEKPEIVYRDLHTAPWKVELKFPFEVGKEIDGNADSIMFILSLETRSLDADNFCFPRWGEFEQAYVYIKNHLISQRPATDCLLIGAGTNFTSKIILYENITCTSPPLFEFQNESAFNNKIYGLKLNYKDSTYFGWALFEMEKNIFNVTEYAYRTRHEVPIKAGQKE